MYCLVFAEQIYIPSGMTIKLNLVSDELDSIQSEVILNTQ